MASARMRTEAPWYTPAGTYAVLSSSRASSPARSRTPQEKIDADARKEGPEYWDCEDETCEFCPSRIDGKRPSEHYGLGGVYEPPDAGCNAAQILDLLRRQRELDKRTMGGE